MRFRLLTDTGFDYIGRSILCVRRGPTALRNESVTADAIAERRELVALLRSMRGIIDEVDGQGIGPRAPRTVPPGGFPSAG